MSNQLCACCLVQPPAGQTHPHSVEIKYGAMKGVHNLCEACKVEVSREVIRMAKLGHEFDVLKNVIINTYEKIARRRHDQRLLAVPMSCRLDPASSY